MNDCDRGKIRNRKFAGQLRDFSGLRFGKITPTDIDGFMDFGNKVFVYIEAKHGGADLPYGQRLALERLCDATQAAGIQSLAIVASHDTDEDIAVADLQITRMRFCGRWTSNEFMLTVREAVEAFLYANHYSQ